VQLILTHAQKGINEVVVLLYNIFHSAAKGKRLELKPTISVVSPFGLKGDGVVTLFDDFQPAN
jgi:hypothetical protein